MACLWISLVSPTPKLRLDGVADGVVTTAVPSETRSISDNDDNNDQNTITGIYTFPP
jgi:hypothetical protein